MQKLASVSRHSTTALGRVGNSLKVVLAAQFAVVLLGLVGCSSVETKVDTGPIAARTFAFLRSTSRPSPNFAENRAPVHAAVQQAISRNLSAKGLKSVAEGSDIIVAYLIIAGNNATTTSLNDYFGYGPDATALVEKVHQEQAVKNDSRAYFESGTLVIDLLDTRTSKVLKRATVQSGILRDLPIEAREARLQKFVDQALSDLKIAK